MKINQQILSLPPYISTSWKSIQALWIDETENLVILLYSKEKIKVPNLEKSILNAVFDAHAKYMEKPKGKIGFSLPMPIEGVEGIESFGSMMQHNPNQANAPDLPPEILNKITAISKIMGIEDTESLPKPEPHCNCIHCQIARALKGEKEKSITEDDDGNEVTEEDLKFRMWDIEQTGKKLFSVTNPLDKNEKYNVFLGKPIGCTCGQKNCEHIRAVLNS